MGRFQEREKWNRLVRSTIIRQFKRDLESLKELLETETAVKV
jgi:hypothetical protein